MSAGQLTEALFAEAYAVGHLRPVDRLYHRWGCAVPLIFLWMRLRQEGLSLHGWAAVVAAVVPCVQDWAWAAWRVDAKPRLRVKMALANRATVLGVAVCMWYNDPVDGPWPLVRFLLLNTGVLTLPFISFAIPLMTRTHLAVHVPTVVAMALLHPGRACSGGAIGEASAPAVGAAWRWLDWLFTGGRGAGPVPEPQEACRDILVMAFVVAGLLLPSYVLWTWENRARVRFNPALASRITWKAWAMHVVVFAVSTSLLWAFMRARTRP